MRLGERSLVRRVGWTAAVSALVASIATLIVALVVIDHRVIADAESDALDRSQVFIAELEAEMALGPVGPDQVADEIDEFSHGDVLLAVDRYDAFVAGSTEVPGYTGRGCAFVEGAAQAWLVCTAKGQSGWRVRVGEPRAQLLNHRGPLLLGGLIALFTVVLGSVLAGFVVARWSLSPLIRLRAALDALREAPPGAAPALPRSGLVEVDVVAATLDDVLERLRKELVRSRNFSADAAHELRTPLTKLRTELELLHEELPSGSEHRRRLGTLVDRTVALAHLVDQLLMLASPAGALRTSALVSVAVELETVVAGHDRGARVEVSLRDDGTVQGDAAVIRTMIGNAIDNALKFSEGLVYATVFVDHDDVVVSVDDEGPGLDPEFRLRAFEPFFRVPAHRARPGHGIGLALIAHVAEVHGGTAAFVDGPPGTHLEIRLPHHQ